MKIVISAVNLTEGGPLTVLNNCLSALSEYCIEHQGYEAIAIVNDKKRCLYTNVQYIELQWPKRHWLNRVLYEYVYLRSLSKRLNPILFISLHDMSPSVTSKVTAVYCHNASPFYHSTINNIRFNYKEFLFSIFYRYLYRINIHKNDFVIVQQKWIKEAFVEMFAIEKEKIIVAKPFEEIKGEILINNNTKRDVYRFFYPAFPRTFKNFEVICKACSILEEEGIGKYEVVLTLDGTENRYSKHIYETYSHLKSICFSGLLPRNEVVSLYENTDCLIFSSKLETWGLPVSEFLGYHRPMLIADLPYAHETSAGAELVSFFKPDNPDELAELMKNVLCGNYSEFTSVPLGEVDALTTTSWDNLFDKLLEKNND